MARILNLPPLPAASARKANLVRRASRPTVATNCDTLSLKNEWNPYLKSTGSKREGNEEVSRNFLPVYVRSRRLGRGQIVTWLAQTE